ncbi:MAG: hypothetical protein SO044_09230, partial [Agathobaculum sp.]|uniref:hypothetical protein n=1 Tax=Agathobaculum sp. TaxID=2048138 RepID=UPI002A8388CA
CQLYLYNIIMRDTAAFLIGFFFPLFPCPAVLSILPIFLSLRDFKEFLNFGKQTQGKGSYATKPACWNGCGFAV